MLWRISRLSCVRGGLQLHARYHDPLVPQATYASPLARLSSAAHAQVDRAESQIPSGNDQAAQIQALTPEFTKHSTLLARNRLPEHDIKICGLVRSIRKHKKVAFAHISDGSTYEPMQAMLRPEDAKDMQNGAYVELQGSWRESPGKGQSHEMHVEQVLRLGHCEAEESPIQKKSQTVDHLRAYPHLRLRTPLYSLLSRIRNQVIGGVHDFYSGSSSPIDEALFVQPPLITSSDCEGAGEVFTVSPKNGAVPQAETGQRQTAHYFRSPKYLTVSSQLHLEAFSAELGDVWTLSSAFRAEESDTARHLSELTMLEAEFRGITRLEDLTFRTQRLIQHVVGRLVAHPSSHDLLRYYADNEHRPEDIPDCDVYSRWTSLQGAQWRTIAFTDAIAELKAASNKNPSLFKTRPSWKNGLQLEHERWLTQNPGSDKPIFVTHYPAVQKPFYMLASDLSADSQDPSATVACFDLLLPHGACEVVGGSLREHRLENLVGNMRHKGLLASNMPQEAANPESSSFISQENYPYLKVDESLNSLRWYADLRRYGSSPHGGFGLGFDRLLMYLTGVNNVRDIVGFPRTFGRADC